MKATIEKESGCKKTGKENFSLETRLDEILKYPYLALSMCLKKLICRTLVGKG